MIVDMVECHASIFCHESDTHREKVISGLIARGFMEI